MKHTLLECSKVWRTKNASNVALRVLVRLVFKSHTMDMGPRDRGEATASRFKADCAVMRTDRRKVTREAWQLYYRAQRVGFARHRQIAGWGL